MQGIFTGVGVGPGDPELMTLKAVRTVKECGVIAVPVSDAGLKEPYYEEGEPSEQSRVYLEKCVAYQITVKAVPEAAEKARLFLPMPMIKEKEILKAVHDRDAKQAAALLDEGKNMVFLTIGDPSVYSTCMYVHKRLVKMGYPTALVPGIPSFCAAAAAMDIPLVENREELHVIPASYGIEESLALPGTKVLMKAGKKMPLVKETLLKEGMDAKMVENCGMADERIFRSAGEIPEEAGYYSLLVIKEKKNREDGGEKS